MRQPEPAWAVIQHTQQSAAGLLVRVVARWAEDTLLQVSGIGSRDQAVAVVIGLKYQQVCHAQCLDDRAGDRASVGHEADAPGRGREQVTAWGGGVVRGGEAVDLKR